MPSLADAYEATPKWERRRLLVGAALLPVGAGVGGAALASLLAAAVTAVGVAESTAVTLGVAVAALAVPVAGAGLLRWVPAEPRFRTAGAVGVVLSAVAVAAFVVSVPDGGPAAFSSVPLSVTIIYLVGALLALWSPVLAAGRPTGNGGPSRPATAFVRETRSVRPTERVPADGGEEAQELAFLLDQDDT